MKNQKEFTIKLHPQTEAFSSNKKLNSDIMLFHKWLLDKVNNKDGSDEDDLEKF